MCTPLAIGAAALSIGSQSVSAIGQAQQARQANSFNRRRFENTSTAALQSYISQVGDLQRRYEEETQALVQTGMTDARNADRARGTVRASAGARGVSGTTVSELVDQFNQIEAENQFTLEQNRLFLTRQLNSQAEGLQAQAEARINGAVYAPIAGPNPLAIGLGIGQSVLTGYDLAGRQGVGPFASLYGG